MVLGELTVTVNLSMLQTPSLGWLVPPTPWIENLSKSRRRVQTSEKNIVPISIYNLPLRIGQHPLTIAAPLHGELDIVRVGERPREILALDVGAVLADCRGARGNDEDAADAESE